MKRKLLAALTLVVAPAVLALGSIAHTGASINYNDLINDGVFDNAGTMSAAQIDAFLNGFSSSCISSHHGFKSPAPTGYNPTNGFLYGSDATAGTVIYDAAQAYGLNPQVLLATIQKEQSLVTGSAGCGTLAYAAALGYGCPDGGTTYTYSNVDLYTLNGKKVTSVSGTCVNSKLKVGFSQQLIHAAWLLKFDRERAEGKVTWAVIKGNWNNSDDPPSCYAGYMTPGYRAVSDSATGCGGTQDNVATFYDGKATIDGTSVTIQNGATAALYDYTPHKSGNSSFVTIFDSWFGSTYYKYAADVTVNIYSDAAHTQPLSLSSPLPSGRTFYVTVSAVNTGSQTWSNSFTRVATENPNNRSSVFQNSSWLSYNRPAQMNESSVAPTATGTFAFSMTTPNTDGTYSEGFGLVADGQNQGWMLDNATFGFDITVSNPFNGTITSLKTYRDSGYTQPVDPGVVTEGQTIYTRAVIKNTGSQTWSNSFTRVATENPNNRSSVFSNASWLAPDRPTAMSESSIAPGQSGTFSFSMTAPGTNGIYNEQFGLVADGQNSGWMPAPIFTIHSKVVAPPLDTLYAGIRLYPGQSLQSKNGVYTVDMQTDGNLVIYCSKGAIWASGTNGKPVAVLVMQGDGNLVMYSAAGKPVWSSRTNGKGASNMILQDDGNLVIYDGQGHPTWASGTEHNIANTPSVLAAGQQLQRGGMLMSANGRYRLVMQGNGDLVIYASRHAIWDSRTGGETAIRTIMQADGNLVIYASTGKPLWASGTNGHSGSKLIMQTDGNLVIYDTTGHALWASGTNGKT